MPLRYEYVKVPPIAINKPYPQVFKMIRFAPDYQSPRARHILMSLRYEYVKGHPDGFNTPSCSSVKNEEMERERERESMLPLNVVLVRKCQGAA